MFELSACLRIKIKKQLIDVPFEMEDTRNFCAYDTLEMAWGPKSDPWRALLPEELRHTPYSSTGRVHQILALL